MGEAHVPRPRHPAQRRPRPARLSRAAGHGRSSRARSCSRRLGPRQIVGAVWEPERLKAEEVGDNRLRPLVHAYDLPPLAAPLAPADRMDRGLLSRAARRGAAHGPALVGRARGRALDHRISRDRPGPRAPDPAARAGAGADRRAPGAGQRARRSSAASPTASSAASSRRARSRRSRSRSTIPSRCPIRTTTRRRWSRPRRRRRPSSSPRSMRREFAPWLLDGVTGSGKTEVYFEAIAAGASRRAARRSSCSPRSR